MNKMDINKEHKILEDLRNKRNTNITISNQEAQNTIITLSKMLDDLYIPSTDKEDKILSLIQRTNILIERYVKGIHERMNMNNEIVELHMSMKDKKC